MPRRGFPRAPPALPSAPDRPRLRPGPAWASGGFGSGWIRRPPAAPCGRLAPGREESHEPGGFDRLIGAAALFAWRAKLFRMPERESRPFARRPGLAARLGPAPLLIRAAFAAPPSEWPCWSAWAFGPPGRGPGGRGFHRRDSARASARSALFTIYRFPLEPSAFSM